MLGAPVGRTLRADWLLDVAYNMIAEDFPLVSDIISLLDLPVMTVKSPLSFFSSVN